jgi:hypothetical protein
LRIGRSLDLISTIASIGLGAIVKIASHLLRKARRAENLQMGLATLNAAEEGRS